MSSETKIGSLFSGAGMLDEGVRAVLGGEVAWHCETDPAASWVLAHRYLDVPNLGDVTAVDWSAVEPVDVITGGSPCQDVSHAGKRAGMRAGTRSGLWASMCDAIEAVRPRMVVWENVRGVLSAEADSGLEPCPGCVGDRDDGPVLRALGRVLGDLAELRYDARWCGLRAAEVGAPHGRFRVFVAATDADDHRPRARRPEPSGQRVAVHVVRAGAATATDTPSDGRNEGWTEPAGLIGGSDAAERGPTAPDSTGTERRGPESEHLATRPVATAESRECASDIAWGQYEPAIRRWEQRTSRIAPAPTEQGAKGGQRLSPRFVEWMMGWPAGWVTDVPGITRNDALRICGNGVVPQQAAAALSLMLSTTERNAA